MTVGVIDSGFDADSAEFIGRFHPLSTDVTGAGRGYDEAGGDGHGTNVAQVLLGARNNLGTMGIAFDATLLALRADRADSCTDTSTTTESKCRFPDSAIAAGIDRAISANARVINISLGGGTAGSQVLSAIQRAAAAGIVVIVAAGNDGDGSNTAVDPNQPDPFASSIASAGQGMVIIAGAVDKNGVIGDFSNRAGAYANQYLSALGVRVCCDYENGQIRTTTDATGTYVYLLNGTSFAAPQISGAAVLLAQAFPNLTGRQIVELLLTSAREAGNPGTDAVFGRGILDIARAFAPQGSATLAGSNAALPLDQLAGMGSGATGDATTSGVAQTVVLDSYGRAYAVDLAKLHRSAPVRPRLAAALADPVRQVGASVGATAVSVSLRQGGLVDIPPLALGPHQRQQARAIAAGVVSRISPNTSVAFGIGRGGDSLFAPASAAHAAPFLLASGAQSLDRIGARGTLAGGARRLAFGGAVTATLEEGRIDPLLSGGRQGRFDAFAGDYRYHVARVRYDRGVGRLDLQGGASLMTERDTLLGARLLPGLAPVGASTLFFDAGAGVALSPSWRIDGEWREGFTRAGQGGVAARGATVRSQAWSMTLTGSNLVSRGDRLALRYAQPLAVTGGALALEVPVAYDYATLAPTMGNVSLSLAPKQRERVAEAVWSAPLAVGSLSLGGYWRTHPEHRSDARDDLGAAVRLALGF